MTSCGNNLGVSVTACAGVNLRSSLGASRSVLYYAVTVSYNIPSEFISIVFANRLADPLIVRIKFNNKFIFAYFGTVVAVIISEEFTILFEPLSIKDIIFLIVVVTVAEIRKRDSYMSDGPLAVSDLADHGVVVAILEGVEYFCSISTCVILSVTGVVNVKVLFKSINYYFEEVTIVHKLAIAGPAEGAKIDHTLIDRPILSCYLTDKLILISSCGNSSGCFVIASVNSGVATINDVENICKLCRNVKSDALLCTVVGVSANIPGKLRKIDVLLSIPNEGKLGCAKLVSVVGYVKTNLESLLTKLGSFEAFNKLISYVIRKIYKLESVVRVEVNNVVLKSNVGNVDNCLLDVNYNSVSLINLAVVVNGTGVSAAVCGIGKNEVRSVAIELTVLSPLEGVALACYDSVNRNLFAKGEGAALRELNVAKEERLKLYVVVRHNGNLVTILIVPAVEVSGRVACEVLNVHTCGEEAGLNNLVTYDIVNLLDTKNGNCEIKSNVVVIKCFIKTEDGDDGIYIRIVLGILSLKIVNKVPEVGCKRNVIVTGVVEVTLVVGGRVISALEVECVENVCAE